MEKTDYMVSRYDRAIMLLPHTIRQLARSLDKEERASAEEVRLRTGEVPTVLIDGQEKEIGREKVTHSDIRGLIELATQASAHSAGEAMKSGFFTANSGYRIGLGGSVSVSNGEIIGFREISSVSLRISREMRGCADEIMKKIIKIGKLQSTILISPPGCGKTTLLRDIIRTVSNGCLERGISPHRVALCDERGEVAAMYSGVMQMDVGRHTDVIDSCPKAPGVMMALRALNPQVIALDEITAPKDVEAMEMAANCGVTLLATAHAENVSDLKKRALYKRLLEAEIFRSAVVIERRGNDRTYHCEELEV